MDDTLTPCFGLVVVLFKRTARYSVLWVANDVGVWSGAAERAEAACAPHTDTWQERGAPPASPLPCIPGYRAWYSSLYRPVHASVRIIPRGAPQASHWGGHRCRRNRRRHRCYQPLPRLVLLVPPAPPALPTLIVPAALLPPPAPAEPSVSALRQ